MERPLGSGCAVVVGGSSGIGLATARALATLGHPVVINGRDQQTLDHAQAQLRADGLHVSTVAGDAAEPETCRRLVCATDEIGTASVLVLCVGGGTVGRTWQSITVEDLADSHRRNLQSTLLPIQALGPQMTAAGYGRIVTVSSLAGRRYGRVSGPDYSAHKAAVVGLTRAIAAEMAPSGVTVNCVAPGIIDTDRARHMVAQLPADRAAEAMRSTPLGRMGTVEEVAAAIVFLASPAAGFITGHTLDVNGGAFMN